MKLITGGLLAATLLLGGAGSAAAGQPGNSHEKPDYPEKEHHDKEHEEHKITICHIPPGNPANAHEITIDLSALPAHLAHGDNIGACVPHETTTTKPPHECKHKCGHETTTTRPPHETTTTKPPHETTTTKPHETTTTKPRETTTTPPPTTSGPTTTATPTTPSTPTTPPIVPPVATQFSFNGVSPVCSKDVPFISITFSNNFPQLDGHVGTLTMTDINGNFISSQPLTFQSGATVKILYPGATVDAAGNATDWPGWKLNSAGLWVTDPTDAIWRDGINLSYTVNPTATAFVAYPPETSACASPENIPGESTPKTKTKTNLPFTGADVLVVTVVGVSLFGAGTLLRRSRKAA